MEKVKSAAELRRERFDAARDTARSIGDQALRDIDAVLLAEDNLLQSLREAQVEEVDTELYAARGVQTSPNFYS